MAMLKDKDTNKVLRCPNCNKPISSKSDYYTDHKTGNIFHSACFTTYLEKQGITDDEIKGIIEDAQNSDDGPQRCTRCGKLIQDDDEKAVHQIMGSFGLGNDEEEIDMGWLCGKCHEKSDREMFGYYHE